jgi:hypothetical protein
LSWVIYKKVFFQAATRRKTRRTTEGRALRTENASCLPANELQCSFAQHVGIALAVTGKFDELGGDALFDVVVAVSGPQSDANKFEGNTEDTPSLGAEVLTIARLRTQLSCGVTLLTAAA